MNSDYIRKYYVPPPYISTRVVYQDVNKDPNLRKLNTDFFLKKSIKWITNYSEFKHLKNKLSKLKSDNGYNIMYNLLRNYVNSNNINWYDLKDNYSYVKDYLRYNLGKI